MDKLTNLVNTIIAKKNTDGGREEDERVKDKDR